MDLMNLFEMNDLTPDISVLDIIKDFAECNDCTQPIKGGLALNYLYEDAHPSSRNTVDVDYHFKNKEDWNRFKFKAIENANNNSKLGVQYKLIKEKVNPNGSSLTIEFSHKDLSGKFKVDMDYGDYCKCVKLKNVTLYSPEMILADKISVLCSTKIQRRTKDLYDIFLIICNENFNLHDLVFHIRNKLNSRGIDLSEISILNPDILVNVQRGYRRIKSIAMPRFEEVCTIDLRFILPVLSLLDNKKVDNLFWDKNSRNWNTGKIYGSRLATDIRGVICKESASGILGLSTFPPFPILMFNDKIDLDMGLVKFEISDDTTHNINEISNGIYITNKERTIVDMLEDGEYRILMESLREYKDTNKDLCKLLSVAKEYNKEHLLKIALDELEEFED